MIDHKYDCATNSIGQIDEASAMGCTCGADKLNKLTAELMEHNTITDLADNIDDYCEKNGLEICTMNTITILQERGLLARQFPRKRKITTKQLEKIIELMREN